MLGNSVENIHKRVFLVYETNGSCIAFGVVRILDEIVLVLIAFKEIPVIVIAYKVAVGGNKSIVSY